MPQPKKAARFGGSPAHHSMILANLTTELFRHGRVRTTLAKAKTVQPVAERMVTFAKRGDLHGRRRVLRVIRDRDVVHKLFTDVGPTFAGRDGGYTRVLKLGPRKGDAAPMALLELVEGVAAVGEGSLEEAPRRRWSLRRRRGTPSATARDRAEERLAAADRGEELDQEDSAQATQEAPAGGLEGEAPEARADEPVEAQAPDTGDAQTDEPDAVQDPDTDESQPQT
ncbi:MAG: 50S ribosomal protein L17 [Actinomycetota bacterium]|nr:50S ribosomal protein L17 [Actinomycetota bacterium]